MRSTRPHCSTGISSNSGSPPAPDSLEIKERSDGKVSIRCFKGCDYEQILGILDLSPRDLYPQEATP